MRKGLPIFLTVLADIGTRANSRADYTSKKMEKFGEMKLSELRNECRIRGAKVDGRKQDLVERLEAYERNQNFGQPSSLEPEFNLSTPEADVYRDINLDSPLPPVTEGAVSIYLGTVDAKVTKKARSLYQERYLSFCRWAPGQEGTFFVRAKCQAQMKSGVTYIVDIELDKNGIICAAQCECAAGMGPAAHCKHAVAVMHGLSVCAAEGELKVAETCTMKLQRFHAVKRPHGGSPVKANDLKLPFGDATVFDPRPLERRNTQSYASHFFNVWKACPTVVERPVSHLFPPANIRGTLHDHSYCFPIGTAIDTCLKGLGVTGLDQEEREKLEVKTRGQSSNQQWAVERTKRLQSSSFGRICKMTDRTDAVKFADSLTYVLPQVKSASVTHGRKYEQVALKKFEEQCGEKTQTCGVFVCEHHPYLGGSPDALVIEADGTASVVEVKCPYTMRDQVVSSKTVPYLEEEDGIMKLKQNHDYHYQVQGQMLCAGAQNAYFVVYSFRNVVVLNIARDNAFIQTMVTKLKAFYDRYFMDALLEMHLFRTYTAVEDSDNGDT